MVANDDMTWTRTCPVCNKAIVHKNKAKCRDGEKHNKPCADCNRKAVGAANARSTACPLCAESLKISRTKRGSKIAEEHAMTHGVTAEKLWMARNAMVDKPKCECGCGQEVAWGGWWTGFSKFVLGHNAKVEGEAAKQIRLDALRARYDEGLEGWSKGLTKDTDERVRVRASRTSEGRKKAFDEGRITVWSTGLTKENDERLAAYSDKLKRKFASGELSSWHLGKSERNDERIKAKNERLRKRFADGELKIWSEGLCAANDERIRMMAEKRREACASLGFEYPTRMSLEEVKQRLSSLKQIEPVDKTFSNYRNWQLRNLMFRCVDCGTTSMESLQTAVTDRCVVCNPSSSAAQREIFRYISEELGCTDAIINDRVLIKPYELDVTVPSKRFAVEYNGLYFHNARYKSPEYHDRKALLAKNNNYVLLHVFEDEWSSKRDIVKSMIRHRLGMNQKLTGGARACRVVELNSNDRKIFFTNNHLEGDVGAVKAYGLVDKSNRLVAAASLRFPMHRTKYSEHLELARFATANDLSIPGALSRLTSTIVEATKELNYAKLLTYADGRVGHGKAYQSSGWKYVANTEPRFWWTDNHVRYNRFKVRAGGGETERQKADRLGLTKIYGCRNYIYTIDVKDYSSQE